MKKLFYFTLLLSSICIVLISSSFKPATMAVPSEPVFCIGPACEDANGLHYNTKNPLFGKKVCCGKEDSDRGCQAG